ncbi:hypothetical protein Taro_049270 [Colocasia esculenta]|uniref:Uncharacterized protein n=1 Tax=Colocasia esculenta TaxID=4460 RepID=A0A843XAB5_COLES|nr:hypothetical protein [Colocasia esculenta]
MSLHLVGIVWSSSWRLGSRRSSTPSRSSSPSRLLRPAQTVHLKSTKECKRLSPVDWARFYPLSAQQLDDLNASQVKINKPPVSADEFQDMNSIHLVRDPFATWVERYKVYVAMRLELKQK